MLPLYLSIEGLYSYQTKQEIDFSRLTETGLFGIFGNVGSGKSSILEAIGFALYGETERLNKQEKRTYNMLNLKSDAACIVFDFLNFENRKFRFVAQWKRKKKFEETSTLERLSYEWIGDNWVPMESAEGALVTNLSYANFRRTIIIPQGQFKEFLELKGKERSYMMKEIFNLNRFDLGPKTAVLQRTNNSKLEHLRGALSGFETVSVEKLQEKLVALESAQRALLDLKTITQQLESQCKTLADNRQNRLNLQAKQEEFTLLNQDKARITQLDNELRVYENTNRVFRELLNVAFTLNKDKEQLTYKLEQLTTKKRTTLHQLEQKEKEWLAIADDFQRLEFFRAEVEDLKLLIANAEHAKELNVLNKRVQDGKPVVEKEQAQEAELQKSIFEKELGLDELKNGKADTTALLAIENWYQTDETLKAQIIENAENKKLYVAEIESIGAEFTKQNLLFETWEEQLAEQEKNLEKYLHQLQEEETQLNVQLKLAEFADNLEDGHSCPLCGSLDHPQPMVSDDLASKSQSLQQEKNNIRKEISELKLNVNQLTRSATRLKDKQTQAAQADVKLTDSEHRQKQHLDVFSWSDFSPTDKSIFLTYKQENQLAEERIRSIEQEIKDLRQQLSTVQGKIEKYKGSLAEFEQKIVVLDSLIAQNLGQLRYLKAEDFKNKTEIALAEQKERVADRLAFLEKSYISINEVLQQLRTELAAVNAERNMAKEQFQQLAQLQKEKQAEISALLNEHGFNDTMQVQQVLQKNLNTEEIRQRIQDFAMKVQLVQNKIEELQQLIEGDNYSEEEFKQKSELFILKQEELELQVRSTGALESECTQLQVEVEKKERLLEDYQQLSIRKSNLTTLENLFRGAGFVNYVSSIHLQRLCSIANERFHRLTRNSLSLTINESNEFEVIDFLNNGFKRSVKTLSGGQSFQASLCLALALAENIQALNKADRNFFFIDEGFGTQDTDSINTVFETLQYLHKENRIVGIISHVEELKERIPSSITVKNDKEKGSQVQYN
ncbi:SMC family ATPase [Sphingobacterium sp. MYb382]|uniref:SMC family ATPase n=1 Tax=Sphingobacterium sp. MYb382 TaxID=2745278 RepID=UPI0030990337